MLIRDNSRVRKNYLFINKQIITLEERKTLGNLQDNHTIIIKEADKGGSTGIVIMNTVFCRETKC